MTGRTALRGALEQMPVIGIIRGCPSEHVVAAATAAFDAGILALEVTLDSPSPFDAIRAASAALPDALIGAGTVRTPDEVDRVAAAGAAFIVAPIVSVPVIEAAVAAGIPVLPGAASPTEIWTAVEAGAFAVKVFPARELGGPAYLKAIAAPLGHPALVPTGGVGIDDAAAYLSAGALAVGIGGSVFPSAAMAAGDAGRVGSLATELVRSLG